MIAPAYRHFCVKDPIVDATTTILHCPEDDLVMFKDSEKLKTLYGAKLIDCGADHRMSDAEALMVLKITLDRIDK